VLYYPQYLNRDFCLTAREVKAMRAAIGYYSRRHIDLQRIASALCPAPQRG
jgi:hypothetical protein